MTITTAQIKDIRTAFAKLKPVKVTLDGNRSLTIKEAVFALAPTLERMKKRGFDIQEIAEKLEVKGIAVKPPTLAKYLAEFRRRRERKSDRPAHKKQDDTPPAAAAKPEAVRDEAARQQECSPGSIVIKPDTPLDEL
jgi:hypothetical protein